MSSAFSSYRLTAVPLVLGLATCACAGTEKPTQSPEGAATECLEEEVEECDEEGLVDTEKPDVAAPGGRADVGGGPPSVPGAGAAP